MVKKLSKIGNSLGIVLDRPLLEKLGIDAKTEIEVSTDGTIIVLVPKRDVRHAKLKKVSDSIFDRYAEAFRKLAE